MCAQFFWGNFWMHKVAIYWHRLQKDALTDRNTEVKHGKIWCIHRNTEIFLWSRTYGLINQKISCINTENTNTYKLHEHPHHATMHIHASTNIVTCLMSLSQVVQNILPWEPGGLSLSICYVKLCPKFKNGLSTYPRNSQHKKKIKKL